MRAGPAVAALLLLAGCGGTGSGVILQRDALGIDSPVPTAAPATGETPPTAPATTTTGVPAPTEPSVQVVDGDDDLRASRPFLFSVDRQQDARERGYEARFVGHFGGAERRVAVAVSGERFRVELEDEDELWLYDGGVATPGAVRCAAGACTHEEGQPPVSAVQQELQPLVAPLLMPDYVVRAVEAGASVTISHHTDGQEPLTCTVVGQFDRSVGFRYCVNADGALTSFAQGDDYEVTLVEWTAGAADSAFVPPHPVR